MNLEELPSEIKLDRRMSIFVGLAVDKYLDWKPISEVYKKRGGDLKVMVSLTTHYFLLVNSTLSRFSVCLQFYLTLSLVRLMLMKQQLCAHLYFFSICLWTSAFSRLSYFLPTVTLNI